MPGLPYEIQAETETTAYVLVAPPLFPSEPFRPKDTYSALKPLTCRILICLTIVLFPDSPAPEERDGRRHRETDRQIERNQIKEIQV